MKKIISIFLFVFIFTVICNAQEMPYTCGNGHDDATHYNTGCIYGNRLEDIKIGGYYNTEAEAYAAAQSGWASLKTTYATFNGSSLTVNGRYLYTETNDTIWGNWNASVSRCSTGTGNQWIHQIVYYYKKPEWHDEDRDCALDDQACLKYKPLMKVTDKTSGCLYYAKIMDEKCNVSSLGDSSIINAAMSGTVNVNIQSYNAPSRDTESTCSMNAPFYDCNNGFTETACSGINLNTDDNKSNPITQDIVNGQSVANEQLQQGEGSNAGDTDSQLLAKIVNNTDKFVINQQSISDQITGIANQIQNKESFNNELSNNDILNKMNEQEAESKQAFNEIQAPTQEDYREQSEFTENDQYSEDIDEKINDVSPDGTVNGVIEKYADNSILTGFQNSRIEIINPDCSIEVPFSLWGYSMNIEINACQWDGILTQTGNVLYVVVCIGCFLTVIRGK